MLVLVLIIAVLDCGRRGDAIDRSDGCVVILVLTC